MSIRLVGDDQIIFWFTTGNWAFLLSFIEKNGWVRKGKLLPEGWDESFTWDENWEIKAGEHVDAEAARELAEWVSRGISDPQHRQILQLMLDERNVILQQKFPGHMLKIEHYIDEWSKFVEFAQRCGFRIDLTD